MQLTILYKHLFLSPTALMHTCTKFLWLQHHKFFTLFDDIKPRCLEEGINCLVDDNWCFEGLRQCTPPVTFHSSQKIQTFIFSITDGLRGTNRLTQRISALTMVFFFAICQKKTVQGSHNKNCTSKWLLEPKWSDAWHPTSPKELRDPSKLSKLVYLLLLKQLNHITPYTMV